MSFLKFFEIEKVLDTELFNDLIRCFSRTKIKQVEGTFGRFQCVDFWKKLDKATVFYNEK